MRFTKGRSAAPGCCAKNLVVPLRFICHRCHKQTRVQMGKKKRLTRRAETADEIGNKGEARCPIGFSCVRRPNQLVGTTSLHLRSRRGTRRSEPILTHSPPQ